MARKHNKKDMTVTEQIEAIAEDFCNHYCKYPAVYHEYYLTDRFETEEEATEAMHCEQCGNCPLSEL